jgi:hypothetical protein
MTVLTTFTVVQPLLYSSSGFKHNDRKADYYPSGVSTISSSLNTTDVITWLVKQNKGP